jgi:uncharacterized protein YbbC (DUF1343 family)
VCRGFQIQVTDPATYRPYLTTLALLQDVIALQRDRFAWKEPPYEYVTDRPPIDVLTGDPAVREALESGGDLRAMERSWRREIKEFAACIAETRTFPAAIRAVTLPAETQRSGGSTCCPRPS